MKRDLLTINDLTVSEIEEIFSLTGRLKEKNDPTVLKGKVLGLIFNKPSTRTRVSFESGILRLGGQATFLNFSESQVGRGESLEDTAKVLSRFWDGIIIRTGLHKDIEVLAKNAAIPVINGLSDLYHPCQVLTDIYTIIEKKGTYKGVKVAYVGDADNNMATSWIIAAAKLDINLTLSCPEKYSPSSEAMELVSRHGNIEVFVDAPEGVKEADIIYTDVWVSMGQESEKQERMKAFQKYQINQELLVKAKKDCLVMHCLPAHRGEEITAGVMDGKHSIVFDEAENRMHVQKGILAFLLK